MYKSQQQQSVDSQGVTGYGSDPKSWISGDDQFSLSRTLSSLSAAAATASATGNVDRVLFNDLVEMVPLVQSLIERKANSSFTRRGSMIYTKTPSRETLHKKTTRSALQTKKLRDDQNKNTDDSQDGCADNSIFSSRSFLSEKDIEELTALQEQVEELKRQISEKDELLKSAEHSKSEMASILIKFDELKNELAEKDSLFRSTQLQLSDVKVKLADKHAAVEKLQWEAMTSSKKVEKLQEDLATAEGDISCFMLLIEGMEKDEFAVSGEDCDFVPYPFEHNHDSESMNEMGMEMQKLEEAREGYVNAVIVMKENQDEESMAAAAAARFQLQSIVLKQT